MQRNKQIFLVCSVRETVIIISQLLTQLPGLFLSPVFSQTVVIYQCKMAAIFGFLVDPV